MVARGNQPCVLEVYTISRGGATKHYKISFMKVLHVTEAKLCTLIIW